VSGASPVSKTDPGRALCSAQEYVVSSECTGAQGFQADTGVGDFEDGVSVSDFGIPAAQTHAQVRHVIPLQDLLEEVRTPWECRLSVTALTCVPFLSSADCVRQGLPSRRSQSYPRAAGSF